MSEDSNKTPYLYTHYSDFFRRIMEREIYETAPEQESQFKKPYLYDEHVRSEREFSPPGLPPGPQPPWGPTPHDCQPQGGAIGGGQEFCKPGQECGKWFWTCAHQIKGFTAVGGTIQGLEYGADDTVMVTACWNKVDATFTVSVTLSGGTIESSVSIGCTGDDPDPRCATCDDCIDGGIFPTITYTTQQMSVNAAQTIYVDGGGGGPYHWSIISGGGTLNKTVTNAGEGITYTAPASNAGCASNPTIQATDYCDQDITLKIAVNEWSNMGSVATRVDSCPGSLTPSCSPFGGCPPSTPNICNSNNSVKETSYNCIDSSLGSGNCNSCSPPSTCVAVCSSCTACQTCAALAGGGTCQGSLGTFDVRTAAMITGGCCPASLL